jgi:hypothetical protein
VSKPLDELYFTWLYRQVCSDDSVNPTRTYWNLLKLLHVKEFLWIIPNDDNRAEDGRALRLEFLEESGIQDVDENWLHLGCSMLELIIALSRRIAFEAEGNPRDWFWELIGNLGLDKYDDRENIPKDVVDEILDQIIFRTYSRKGRGGLFPLRRECEDQRDVELLYQMNSYILERIDI